MKTEIIEVHPHYPDLEKIGYCAKIIRKGGLVVFPTETVYGIAADFSNPKAIKRLREVKKRSDHKPFSVLISQRGLISNYTSMTDPKLFKLINAFWPGPLTVVVPSKEEEQTIGVRMPDHIIALKLTEEAGCPVAAPSANFEGNKPPVTCQEALQDLDGLVEVAIDGGQAKIGEGSTVLDISQGESKILREGAIRQSEVDRINKQKNILFVCTGNSCRSVMAEYLLKDRVKHRENIEVRSAGTSVFIQSAASADTISVLEERNIDATMHRSEPMGTTLLKQADLIFVMTRVHRQQVLERAPSVEKRVYLLREFANIPADARIDMDIPDPIGKSRADYKQCLEVINAAIEKIVELV